MSARQASAAQATAAGRPHPDEAPELARRLHLSERYVRRVLMHGTPCYALAKRLAEWTGADVKAFLPDATTKPRKRASTGRARAAGRQESRPDAAPRDPPVPGARNGS